MAKLKDFLYLDVQLVNSIFAQYYQGVITSMSKTESDKDELGSKITVDLKLIKASAGGKSEGSSSQNENIDLHHYAYEMLEQALEDDGLLNGGNFVSLKGQLRIIDAEKVISGFDGLKPLISGMEAAMKFSKEQNQPIDQDMKSAATKGKDIGKLVDQLSQGRIYAYIANEKIALNRLEFISASSPEFTNNGKLFKGEYTVIGIKSKIDFSDAPQPDDDMLITLSRAFGGIQDILKTSTIKPIAIYRVVDS